MPSSSLKELGIVGDEKLSVTIVYSVHKKHF
jgi:hypothetical protein